MFPIESLLTTSLIAFALLLLEWLSRISMFSAGAPVPSARLGGFSKRALRLFGRCPQLPALKPLHHGVRMPFLQATQRRQKILALGCAKRRR
jgi:hypothetical protein